VTIPLTRDQWHKILNALKNESDSHYASMTNWLANCADKVLGSESARRYELAYKELDALYAYIERILIPPPEPAGE
jgi:hypothetical protein